MGKFYVVARLYAALWGIAGVWPVFWIARRWSGRITVAAVAAACYVMMPAVVNMAHEGKPHLPGAVLMLLAVVAAAKYVEDGTLRRAVLTGGLCGAALGMLLSGLVAFVLLPVMVLLRRDAWGRRVKVAVIAAA